MSSDDQASTIDNQEAIDKRTPKTKSEKEQRRATDEFNQTETDKQFSMKVKVHSPFRDYYDGRALSVTARNATGPFDILPKHHNFITLLSAGDLIVRTVNGGEQKVAISGGIMHVKADQLIVFLDV